MLKKTITFEDYSEPPREISRDFYFNFTKLEVIEMLEVEDLEGTLKTLQETQDGPKAYEMFKKLILRAYGEKTPEGGFTKEDENGRPLSKKFETLPACSELIIEFLQNPLLGADFIEKCLPAKMVAEAKEAQKNNPSKAELEKMVAEAAERQENPETRIEPGTPPAELRVVEEDTKTFDDFSKEELLEMSQEQFQSLVPRDPKSMTQAQLLVAFERKNKQ